MSGVHTIAYAFPNVKIVTSAIDPEINERFHVLPGIGNFGDRSEILIFFLLSYFSPRIYNFMFIYLFIFIQSSKVVRSVCRFSSSFSFNNFA